ncbi:MAG: hypothetical protein NT141_01250 [candidate division WWE3 bacterium]|nr:hypothetical protein [candidate division WWE3 bacterium]
MAKNKNEMDDLEFNIDFSKYLNPEVKNYIAKNKIKVAAIGIIALVILGFGGAKVFSKLTTSKNAPTITAEATSTENVNSVQEATPSTQPIKTVAQITKLPNTSSYDDYVLKAGDDAEIVVTKVCGESGGFIKLESPKKFNVGDKIKVRCD